MPERIEDGDHIGDAKRHRIRRRVVRRVAPAMAPVIDEDEAELLAQLLQRLGDGRVAHQIDRVEESAEHDDRRPMPPSSS